MWLKYWRDGTNEGNFNQYVMDGFLRKAIPSFKLTRKPAANSWLDPRMGDSFEHFQKLAQTLQRKVFAHMRHHGNVSIIRKKIVICGN